MAWHCDWSSEPTEALQQYEKVFQRAQNLNCSLNPRNAIYFRTILKYFGIELPPAGSFPTAKGTEAIVSQAMLGA